MENSLPPSSKENFEKFPFPTELQLPCSALHMAGAQGRSCCDIHEARQAKTHPEPSTGPSTSAPGTKFGSTLDYTEEDCCPSWPRSKTAAGSPEGPEPITLAEVQIRRFPSVKMSPTSYGLRRALNSLLGPPRPMGKSPGKCHKPERPRKRGRRLARAYHPPASSPASRTSARGEGKKRSVGTAEADFFPASVSESATPKRGLQKQTSRLCAHRKAGLTAAALCWSLGELESPFAPSLPKSTGGSCLRMAPEHPPSLVPQQLQSLSKPEHEKSAFVGSKLGCICNFLFVPLSLKC